MLELSETPEASEWTTATLRSPYLDLASDEHRPPFPDFSVFSERNTTPSSRSHPFNLYDYTPNPTRTHRSSQSEFSKT